MLSLGVSRSPDADKASERGTLREQSTLMDGLEELGSTTHRRNGSGITTLSETLIDLRHRKDVSPGESPLDTCPGLSLWRIGSFFPLPLLLQPNANSKVRVPRKSDGAAKQTAAIPPTTV